MNTKINKVLGGLVIGLALLTASTPRAEAATLDTTLCTNYLPGGTGSNITGWPTNAPGIATGNAVAVYNQDIITVDVAGFLNNTNTTNNAQVFTVQLATSSAVSAPTLLVGTNQWTTNLSVTNLNDWTTNGTPPFSFIIPANTLGWYHVSTNFTSTTPYGTATFVGVYQISNNLSSGNFISNSLGTNGGGSIVKIGKKVKAFSLVGGN